MTWTSEAIPISTSTNRILPAALILIGLVSLSAGTHVDSGGGSFDSHGVSEEYGIPQYESQADIFQSLVAPFLFYSLVLHLGIHRALMFTIAGDPDSWMGRNPEYKKEKKRLRKQSLVLALVITGMLIPTPYFDYLNKVVGYTFGTGIYLALAAISLYLVYVVVKRLFFD